MPNRWTPAPPAPARRPSRSGPGLLVSAAGALFAVMVFTLTLLIAAAMLLPAGFGSGRDVAGGDVDVAASGAPASGVASPAVAGASASGAPAPSASLPPASVPPASAAPVVSAVPASPVASPVPRTASVETVFRRPVPLVIDDRRVGRVTVQGLRLGSATALPIPDDHRLMLATVRYNATGRLAFDAADWQLEGRDGERWEALADAPGTALGSGTLAARQARTGVIAFAVPRGVPVRAVVLTNPEGDDVAAFLRPSATD